VTARGAAVTPADVETFWRDGVVHLRGVLPLELVRAMEAAVDDALASAQSADLTAMARALGPSAPGRGRFVAGIDHWRHQPELRMFACDSPLPEIVATLLRSAHAYLYEDSVLVKEPDTAERTAWHQDLGYFHVEGTQMCTTWCPLDPVTAATGAMRFVRGSHRDGSVYRPNLFVRGDPLPETEGSVVPDVDAGGYDIVSFALEPGDVSVHHARTLHAAGGNRSQTTRRRAISVRYCGDDAHVRIRPGAPLKPHQRGLRDGDPLGGDAHPQVWPRQLQGMS
jgi:ectoine hydroxylase-related dioxygenase (phytanoyl-CoA dioxygenase family)